MPGELSLIVEALNDKRKLQLQSGGGKWSMGPDRLRCPCVLERRNKRTTSEGARRVSG